MPIEEDGTWNPDPQILDVINKRLANFRTALIEKLDSPDKSDDPKREFVEVAGEDPEKARGMLRLDWELASEAATGPLSSENIADMMIAQIALDFCDLLENGDTDNRVHPLLSVFNGKVKTGRDLKDIHLGDIKVYKEWVWRNDSTEYTVYTRLSPVWA